VQLAPQDPQAFKVPKAIMALQVPQVLLVQLAPQDPQAFKVPKAIMAPQVPREYKVTKELVDQLVLQEQVQL
jgi:hypothetical protein